MRTFLESLERIEGAKTAVVTPDAELSFGDLCEQADARAVTLAGERVCVFPDDVVSAAGLLVGADGQASVVALLSSGTSSASLRQLVESIEPDLVVGLSVDRWSGAQSAGRRPAQMPSGISAGDRGRQRRGTGSQTVWLLTTSGTTGEPKLVEHTFASLTRTTKAPRGNSEDEIWGLLYEPARFAGLQVVLQSLLSGACLAVPVLSSPLEEQIGFLAEKRCTHLSGTPTLWRRILMSKQARDLDLRQITLGGEVADQSILDLLARAYPQARISHVFASTEAGVGFSVSDGRAGFPVAHLEDPPSGIRLRVADSRLQIHNDLVAGLGGRQVSSDDDPNWVDTGDVVEVVGDRVFFRGREDGVINVGGNKVHPEEIEAALLSHPHVRLARAYARSNPIMGELVAADVVLDPEADEVSTRGIKAHAAAQLPPYAVPAFVYLRSSLNFSTTGKISR